MHRNASVIYFAKRGDVHLSTYAPSDPVCELEAEARETFERILELDPEHEVARLCLGLLRPQTEE